mmetsp:Transcript_51625/g.148911  ORF Transcript_51625/g.148911 Transcript_51625/m.148911 type:complete len:209 (+) Transcript_51625:182-808(+)
MSFPEESAEDHSSGHEEEEDYYPPPRPRRASQRSSASPSAHRSPEDDKTRTFHLGTRLASQGIVTSTSPALASTSTAVSPPLMAQQQVGSPPGFSVGSPSSRSSADSPTHHHHPRGAAAAANKRGIPHVYRDFTNVPDTAGFVRKKTGGVTQPFPEKLHEMLDQVNAPAVVGWLPHGRAFIVRKPKEFTNQIMPQYFRQTKLTSFQRQ